ncbi:RNA polymerase sigma factor [Pseudonocardia oroxyli]|uniref:RNA polymerase sigma-70 factor, ECF subfamily n=1 Tax=Pseudonocardia oroxyli TaxID=366584 RepID=A0A1G8AMB1_PSEOR|nr:RNA polymerase sigma factor [Pseudonocardia oroxyli]SDH22172.1 RNA polymerase sigma-70 factor, ECF subfamily [Pseudonocardia oroxyli]
MSVVVCPPHLDLDAALAAARAGDEEAFVALYRDLQPRLIRYATALVGADAEDVTGETWLHVARDLRRFTGDLDGFRGWVTTICRNRAMDSARARSRRPVATVELAEVAELAVVADDARTDGTALERLGTRRALELILALPRTEAEAVLLRAVVGLDGPTAARVLGKRPGAVRVAAHRGLRRLADQLDPAVVPAPREAHDG